MELDSKYIDELTGVYNRRYLKEKQEGETGRLITNKTPFSIAWVDIDHFKTVNDRFGHFRGDKVIREFAHFLRDSLRQADTIIRFGGDEFICVMPKTTRHDAESIFRRILKTCRKEGFGGLHITISVGISAYPDDGKAFDVLLRISDDALYDAKRSGRDQIGTLRKKRIELPIKTFISRVKEKEKIRNLITDGSEIGVGIVSGNVGIGKTRLVREALMDVKGKEVVWCDCLAFAENIAYYPIRELIRYRINRKGMAILKGIPLVYKLEIGKLIPEVLEEIKAKSEDLLLVLDKYRLYESVRIVLDKGEREKVIIIDNIQWIDKESIEVLKYLIRAFQGTSIRFIFIYRAEEETEFLVGFTSYLSREVEIVDVTLKPFKRHEIRESVRSIIGEEPEGHLVDYVVRESGGNPFYIEQIMRELVDNKYLIVEEDKWRFKKPEQELVPKTVKDITIRKYNQLSKEGQEILKIASVIGRFDIDSAKRITGYNVGHIVGLLEGIQHLGLIREVGDKMEFQEELSRNAVYKHTVTGIKGRMLHKEVGEILEDQHRAKEGDILEQLAYHYYRAKVKDKGVKYCREAGDKATEKYAHSNAIRYYSWAEELLSDETEIEKKKIWIDCMIKRANVLNFIGDNAGAMHILNQGLEHAIEMGDKAQEAQIRERKAIIFLRTAQFGEVLREAADSIKICEMIENHEMITNLLLIKGSARRRMGDYEKALEDFEDSLEIAQKLKQKSSKARALGNLGNIYVDLGDYEKALAKYEESIRLARETGGKDKSALARLLNNCSGVYHRLGDHRKSLQYLDDCLKISREIGDRDAEVGLLNNKGSVVSSLGDFKQARRILEESLEISRTIGGQDNEAMALNHLGQLYYDLGNYDVAQRHHEDALEIAKNTKSRFRIFDSQVSLGQIYLQRNEIEKAKDIIDQLSSVAEQSKDLQRQLFQLLCDFYLEVKDFANFKTTIKKFQDLLSKVASKPLEGCVTLLLGRFCSQTGDFASAEKHLQQALEIFQKLDEKLNIGKSFYYMGFMESKRNKENEAKEYFDKALRVFKTIGAKGWEKKTAEK